MMIFPIDMMRLTRGAKDWEFQRAWACADNEQHGLTACFPMPGSAGLSEEQARHLAYQLDLPRKADESLLRVWRVDTRH
jgi:hypothetical protein